MIQVGEGRFRLDELRFYRGYRDAIAMETTHGMEPQPLAFQTLDACVQRVSTTNYQFVYDFDA